MSQLDWTLWNMDGARMVQMTEADFSDRLPSKHGENLYAQFDIWRTNYNYETGSEQQVTTAHAQCGVCGWGVAGGEDFRSLVTPCCGARHHRDCLQVRRVLPYLPEPCSKSPNFSISVTSYNSSLFQ